MMLYIHLVLVLTGQGFIAAQVLHNTTYLVAPALVTDASNNTIFECWKLDDPFVRASIPGVSGGQILTVTNNTNVAYTIVPPRFDGGLHNAPVPQLVHFLSGIAQVILPYNDSVDLWLMGGKSGLLFAADTTGRGHVTRYPSDQETVAITTPFTDGIVPDHEVIAAEPCFGRQTFS